MGPKQSFGPPFYLSSSLIGVEVGVRAVSADADVVERGEREASSSVVVVVMV